MKWLRGTFHGVSPKHLPRYVDEFSHRFDRCQREGEIFTFVGRRVVRSVTRISLVLLMELVGCGWLEYKKITA